MTARSFASSPSTISDPLLNGRSVLMLGGRMRRLMGVAAGQAALHLVILGIGFALFALASRSGLLDVIDIFFYRGLVLLGIAFAVTLAVAFALARRLGGWGVRGRDGLCAAVLSLSVNLSFFVLFPVTIDRSVTVFLLGEMATYPDRSYTPARMRTAFEATYLGQFRQIERRLDEQAASGNIVRVDDAFVITPQGRAFVRASGGIAWLFGADPRFVSGRGPDREPNAR